MEITVGSWVALSLVFVSIVVRWAWKALDWVWFKPKRLERHPRLIPIVDQSVKTYGIASYEGEKWAKHRRIINATFHVEKLKRMLPAFHQSCNEMITEWKSLVQKGWRFIPTKMNRRLNQIDKEIKGLLKGVINKREQALKAGEATKDDLLGALLESNFKDIEEHGKNNKNVGMSTEDNWQDRARQEVLQVFGSNKPDFDGLNHLKVVTMILLEVLRFWSRSRVTTLLIHRDKELWGDDANEFKPERFSEGISKASKSQLSFVPFGGGPRICIGQNFSLIEAKLVVALILQHFTFELSPSYAHAPSTPTIQPQYGVPIILRRN
ncbi:hypothetical protein M0R45_009581 [Rubus argutus]|uniref:Cytochrome P450 n=1 Tax=Rubus argutus TaxID=59490 RepID=A0AAW1Y7H2_RUBAR